MISFFEVILLRMNFCVALGGKRKRSAHESCDSVTATLGEGQGEGGTGGELPAGSSCPGMTACTSTCRLYSEEGRKVTRCLKVI